MKISNLFKARALQRSDLRPASHHEPDRTTKKFSFSSNHAITASSAIDQTSSHCLDNRSSDLIPDTQCSTDIGRRSRASHADDSRSHQRHNPYGNRAHDKVDGCASAWNDLDWLCCSRSDRSLPVRRSGRRWLCDLSRKPLSSLVQRFTIGVELAPEPCDREVVEPPDHCCHYTSVTPSPFDSAINFTLNSASSQPFDRECDTYMGGE